MKRREQRIKILLAGICIVIVLFIIVHNFIGGFGREKEEPTTKERKESISVENAAYFMDYLIFTREEIADLIKEDGSYLKVLLESGVYEKDDLKESDVLLCGQFRDLLFSIVKLLELNYKEIQKELPNRLNSVGEFDQLLMSEFLQVYDAITKQVNSKEPGKFHRERLYINGVDKETNQSIYFTQKQNPYYADPQYINAKQQQYVTVFCCKDQILMVEKLLEESCVLPNVYLEKGEGTELTVFMGNRRSVVTTSLPMPKSLKNVVADLMIRDGIVSKIMVKAEVISGKVLLAGDAGIEVEGYGLLPLHEDYRIYKVYGDTSMETTNSILVGYSVTDFVVSEGKICAALIKDKIKAKNIRVLINTSNYHSKYHSSVTFTSREDFIVDNGKDPVTFKAGEEVTVAKGCKLMEKGRIVIHSVYEDGKIILSSVNRNYGIPEYRGKIEISIGKKGLLVVNELSIEEYLYSVVPSEMPISYGEQALKVQAVSARSYAYNQLIENRYSQYGAHVDDSVNCQVYNNVQESEKSIMSVKDTYGQVLAYKGNVITTYYFSTSCGYTANIEDVWEHAKHTVYLEGHFQKEGRMEPNLSKEQNFRDFLLREQILSKDQQKLETVKTYDSDFLMYRWKTNFSKEQLNSQINQILSDYKNKMSSTILTYVGNVGDQEVEAISTSQKKQINNLVFAQRPIQPIGEIRDIIVIKRGVSGIIKELMLIGEQRTILLCYQGNVRTFFAPKNNAVIRLDGSTIESMSLLPSAFCIFDVIKENDRISEVNITGGGFGHGVGMSQNGVKALTKEGWDYKKILSHYYPSSSFAIIY